MGQEIEQYIFTREDFLEFGERLTRETQYLESLFQNHQLSNKGPVGGFEIEAWLVDPAGQPQGLNDPFLSRLDNPLVVHELSSFNIELNIDPGKLQENVFSVMQESLARTWLQCRQVAAELDCDIVMIGILPSIRDDDLTLANMTDSNRYRALNHQVLKFRNNSPLHLDIKGEDHLKSDHYDVMLESAATSFQIHLQTPLDQARDFYNLSTILSGPMVATCANSPFLFGKALWDETRIPLFEQAVECGELAHQRVSLGDGYITDSLFECFAANLRDFPVLVPNLVDKPASSLAHLKFHNGTIWRWNRPLLGFDDDGTPHLRIEHRAVPAGPSIVDSIANAAFFYGLMQAMVEQTQSMVMEIPFDLTHHNFYQCAAHGLRAEIQWQDGFSGTVDKLILDRLLPLSQQGLETLDIATTDIDRLLGIIERRVASGQNGASWQRQWVKRYGHNMAELTRVYLAQQNSGEAVSEWEI